MQTVRVFVALGLLFPALTTTYAGKADVTKASAVCDDNSVCGFTVTVEHADDGWEHYADRWDVLTPNGDVLGTRVLLHPHVNEQPFSRSLSGVKVPNGLSAVRIRARDSVHGYGGREITVTIPR
jgi:hypothetical protein